MSGLTSKIVIFRPEKREYLPPSLPLARYFRRSLATFLNGTDTMREIVSRYDLSGVKSNVRTDGCPLGIIGIILIIEENVAGQPVGEDGAIGKERP
jgi:hypothetical protein